MAGKIVEFFGYDVRDSSPVALKQARSEVCPFTSKKCSKTINMDSLKVIAGACTVVQKSADSPRVICCPNRLYGNEYKLLKEVSRIAFAQDLDLFPGRVAASTAINEKRETVAVFGHDWDRELRLPQKDGTGNYFVDWVLAKISPKGELVDFCAIEVQTIDTTGNYRDSRRALQPPSREEVWSTMGLNWENVNKRILPQVIYKGQVLTRESLCQSGLFFVTPQPVFERIFRRLGGRDKVTTVKRLQPSSVTFVSYDFDPKTPHKDGELRPLAILDHHMTTVTEVRDAFNTVALPEPDMYVDAIRNAIGDFAF